MNDILGFPRRPNKEAVGGSDVEPLWKEATTAAGVDPLVRQVFAPFQNLNLLALLEDLRAGHVARGDWATNGRLCPVAHGMPAGQVVADLGYLGQSLGLRRACAYATRYLQIDPPSLARFVEGWDDGDLRRGRLVRQLEALWAERLADADAVQAVLEPAGEAQGMILAMHPAHAR